MVVLPVCNGPSANTLALTRWRDVGRTTTSVKAINANAASSLGAPMAIRQRQQQWGVEKGQREQTLVLQQLDVAHGLVLNSELYSPIASKRQIYIDRAQCFRGDGVALLGLVPRATQDRKCSCAERFAEPLLAVYTQTQYSYDLKWEFAFAQGRRL